MAESISIVLVPHECELLAGIMLEKKGWLLPLSLKADRKVSSSSWHSLVRLGRSTWLIAQQNSGLANDSTYASGIYTLYLEV